MGERDGRYYSFNAYLRRKFGVRVHRLSLNGGFACPNKDGTLSGDGCVFCNERGFSRFADDAPSLREQVKVSMEHASEKYKAAKYIAYFQNASGTYATCEELKGVYDVIREFPEIVGLYISTRPDCIDEDKLDLIESYSDEYDVWIEYGLQTVNDKSLFFLNRRHTFKQVEDAVNMTAKRNIRAGVHVILGIPGEDEQDMLRTAEVISGLPVSGVKLHMFHILRDTPLEAVFRDRGIKLLDIGAYVDIICKFLGRMKRECVIMRLVSDARSDLLVAPEWMRNKHRVIDMIENRLRELDIYQGSFLDNGKNEKKEG